VADAQSGIGYDRDRVSGHADHCDFVGGTVNLALRALSVIGLSVVGGVHDRSLRLTTANRRLAIDKRMPVDSQPTTENRQRAKRRLKDFPQTLNTIFGGTT
jgi:hypothetical protein